MVIIPMIYFFKGYCRMAARIVTGMFGELHWAYMGIWKAFIPVLFAFTWQYLVMELEEPLRRFFALAWPSHAGRNSLEAR